MNGQNGSPMMILHGGAGNWDKFDEDQVLDGMRSAVTAGWQVLQQGHSALDAIVAATIVLEDHPLFDAGVGSYLNDCGEVEMDALITDGNRINFGAVAAVRTVRNPITLARKVMEDTKHSFFVADGADRLARLFGLEQAGNLSFVTTEEFHDYQKRLKEAHPEKPGFGTVGAVAMDASGLIASATSTGGSPHKIKGRVGDVPMYGAGGYSDSRIGGASATGVGENIMRFFLSKMTVEQMETGMSPHEAAQSSVAYIAERIPNPEVGVITLGAQGRIGAAHTTNAMPIAWVDAEGYLHAALRSPYPF